MSRTLEVVVAVVGILSGCAGAAGAAPGGAGVWTLAAYVCADGDLSALGRSYTAGLVAGARAGGWMLAVQIDEGVGAPWGMGTRRFVVGGPLDGAVSLGDERANVGTAGSLADFLRWAGTRAPGTRLGLIVFGHGASPIGLAADGTLMGAEAAVALDADQGDALTAREVAEALDAIDRTVDLLVLDSCFGASADVAWELRERVDVLVASPGRVQGSGLPWRAVLGGGGPGGATPEALAQRCLDEVAGTRDGVEGVTAVRCAGLVEVVEAVQRLSSAIAAEPDAGMLALATARRACRDLGADRELCDLGEQCAGLQESASGAVSEAAIDVCDAIDGCVSGRTGGGAASGGLTVLMPGGLMGVPAGYGARAASFGGASGWGQTMRAYCRGLQDLMQRTTDNSRRGEDAG